jgi:glycogen debranching enzyme
MAEGWTFTGEPAQVSGGTVTLVEGSSFCLSTSSGDVNAGTPQGLFFRDTRILSAWQLRLDDEVVEPLTVMAEEPYRATFVGRARPRAGLADSTLLVERHRFVGAGMREDIVLRNLGREAAACTVTVRAEADFADLFEVKSGHVRGRGHHTVEHGGGELVLGRRWRNQDRQVRITAEGAGTSAHLLTYHVVVPARGRWRTTVQVSPVIDGTEPPVSFPLDRPVEEAAPAVRTAQWQDAGPQLVTADKTLSTTLARSRQDLGALRIFDPEQPDRTAVAAGTPWFMALFGRDSIITALMSIPMDPALALGTAQTLARYQGRRVDPITEEEPGRIPHELRFGVDASLALGGNVYYGTADATPLFVMLLGELLRWGVDREQVLALIPHADRALEWIDRYGDADGDGFVEYRRATDRGLVNQGWKDSWDGVTFADGRVADPPIALCEVQGYVYAAYRARALLAEDAGDMTGARYWQDRARKLKRAFNERFWLPDRGWYALGLDRDKRPIDALASNMGHCLWTGIVDEDKAAAVADRLLSPEMFSGWGVRTLATDMGAYNPMSYHNGSVWPHDNGIIAAGLMRYGFVEHAQRVAVAVLDAAAGFGGRLPELICGFDRSEYPCPVPYPTACSPQAWASATPVELVRVLLRAEPCLPHGWIRIDPAPPERFEPLRLRDIPLGGRRVQIEVRDGEFRLDGVPDGIRVVREPCRCTAADL